MNNLENSLVTIDKLIVCLKSNSAEDLIKFIQTIIKNESIDLTDKVSLSRNTNKNEKDIVCNLKYNLHYHGEEVGILFFSTYNKEDFFFKVKNKVFYESKYSLKFIISLVLTCFPFNYYLNNLTKLDIACDTLDSFIRDNATLIEDQCVNNNYFTNLKLRKQKENVDILKGRFLEDAIYKLTVPRLSTSQIKGIVHIGRIQNSKSVTIYNKNDFLQDYQKSYFHQHFGLDHKIITRVEMKLKSEYFNKRNFEINKIDDQSYLIDFFQKESADYLTFNILNEKLGYDENRNLIYNKLSFLNNFKFKVLPTFNTEVEDILIEKGTKSSNIFKINKAKLTKLLKKYGVNRSEDNMKDIVDFTKNNSLRYSYRTILSTDKYSIFDFLLVRFKELVKDNNYDKDLVNQFIEDVKIILFIKTNKKGNQIVTNQTITIVNRLKNQKYGIEFTKNSNQF